MPESVSVRVVIPGFVTLAKVRVAVPACAVTLTPAGVSAEDIVTDGEGTGEELGTGVGVATMSGVPVKLAVVWLLFRLVNVKLGSPVGEVKVKLARAGVIV